MLVSFSVTASGEGQLVIRTENSEGVRDNYYTIPSDRMNDFLI